MQREFFEYNPLMEEFHLSKKFLEIIPHSLESRDSKKNAISILLNQLCDGIPRDINIRESSTIGSFLKSLFFSFVTPQTQEDLINLIPSIDSRDVGKLSFINSANCLKDETRTKRFVNGLIAAINDQSKIHSQNLHIIDAGCGAIPIFSIISALTSKHIKVTAIESNPASYKIALEIVKGMQLEEQITILNKNILTIEKLPPADIIISETFSPALTTENGLGILANLNKFKKETGVLIPEEVHLSVCLTDYNKFQDFQPKIYDSMPEIHPDFVFQKSIFKTGVKPSNDSIVFNPKKDFNAIDNLTSLEPQLVSIATEFKVYAETSLFPNESIITLHVPVWDENKLPNNFNLLIHPLVFGNIDIKYKEGDSKIYGNFSE